MDSFKEGKEKNHGTSGPYTWSGIKASRVHHGPVADRFVEPLECDAEAASNRLVYRSVKQSDEVASYASLNTANWPVLCIVSSVWRRTRAAGMCIQSNLNANINWFIIAH
ncbi:hypothetical protein M378DRAFT_674400 [Amanita muscaria Koide BX008]|uniref:Uncharacterized protein n=1 Tax=Amanita muscaria (strain Koide BX008) TaxID=946122 RepID=A0A0C2X2C3_AMAMK|nr:hypothetical protein M378DRAFT_674400 [Amanita muscaria Koide BX008]